jgi:hypothetical protein
VRRGSLGCHESIRISLELVQATLAAEVVRRALVIDVTDRIVGRNRHPADGIEHFSWRDGGMAVRVR